MGGVFLLRPVSWSFVCLRPRLVCPVPAQCRSSSRYVGVSAVVPPLGGCFLSAAALGTLTQLATVAEMAALAPPHLAATAQSY